MPQRAFSYLCEAVALLNPPGIPPGTRKESVECWRCWIPFFFFYVVPAKYNCYLANINLSVCFECCAE